MEFVYCKQRTTVQLAGLLDKNIVFLIVHLYPLLSHPSRQISHLYLALTLHLFDLDRNSGVGVRFLSSTPLPLSLSLSQSLINPPTPFFSRAGATNERRNWHCRDGKKTLRIKNFPR